MSKITVRRFRLNILSNYSRFIIGKIVIKIIRIKPTVALIIK
jgi:hypothetical protein